MKLTMPQFSRNGTVLCLNLEEKVFCWSIRRDSGEPDFHLPNVC